VKKEKQKNLVVYQAPNGAVEVCLDYQKETIFLTQQQVAELFGVQKAAISKHVKNIFISGELEEKATVSKMETVQTEGERTIKRKIDYYNLDLILSVGYRVNSINATKFRQWATKTLRQHILQGYTINKKRIAKNYEEFLKAVESVQKLLPTGGKVKTEDALELIKMFANTWLSLDAYDKSNLPKSGASKKQVKVSAEELAQVIAELKENLLKKKEATEFFAQEREKDAITGIIGSVFQAVFGRDAYETLEEKAAHLLYFFVKNHPFIDGNKRSGAFAFVWFLNKSGILQREKISPEALTALTLLVAESNPKDKARVIGLILQLLRK
jgi:prophage maintenance system killer protein/predicted XRE-type DNA-binding protein